MSVRVIATKDYIESRCMKQDNGCWVWQGATASGYGRFKINRKLESAHRVLLMSLLNYATLELRMKVLQSSLGVAVQLFGGFV